MESEEISIVVSDEIEEGTGGEPEEVPIILPKIELKEVPNLPEWIILPPIICPFYTQGYWYGHRAVDLVNKNCNGSDWVISVKSGKVIFTGWNEGYGNQIRIEHENGFVTTYSHLKEIEVEEGSEIKMGSKIGTIGSTGKSTGVHLHFEILYNGIKIDPRIYIKN